MILCPSMMCADFDNLSAEVRSLDVSATDIFHCDIMDGSFAPNFALGIKDIECIRRNTAKPIDAHLMIENPDNKIEWFINAGCDIIYIHPESTQHVVKTLEKIRNAKHKAGLAISPGTGVESIIHVLNLCDYVMAMTVNPGFAGQQYLDFVTDKISRLAEMKKQYGYNLMVDGACSPQKIRELSRLGVDGFVLGTSALFGKDESYKDIMTRIKG